MGLSFPEDISALILSFGDLNTSLKIGQVDKLYTRLADQEIQRVIDDVLKSIIDTFIALTSDSGIVEKLLALSGVPTPVITAFLLWSLRSQFLNFMTSTILKNSTKAKDGTEDTLLG